MHITSRFLPALSLAGAVFGGSAVHAQVVAEGRIDSAATQLAGLDDTDLFGTSAAALGDLDGDGVEDLAVGAPLDDGGGPDRGAIWILFMNADGSIKSTRKINATQGGFTGPLRDIDQFGSSLAALGDLDGDTVVDLAVGAPKDDDGGVNHGAVWVLFLNSDGTVKAEQKISTTAGGFTGSLESLDTFGNAVGAADIDGDGRNELVVGAEQSDDGGQDTGSIWVLGLNTDGTVASQLEIASQTNGFSVTLDPLDRFGSSVVGLGDVDGDGVDDLLVGADADDDGGNNRGALYVLLMNSDASVKSAEKISSLSGDFDGVLANGDRFGASLANLGDLEGDGNVDVAVGSPFADLGGTDRGAVWILSIDASGEVVVDRLIGEGTGGFVGPLDDGDAFGSAVVALGDLDDDGVLDLAVGAERDDNGSGLDVGAVQLAYLGNLPRVANVNGSGTNPQCLIPTNVPILGDTWQLAVSTFSVPNATNSFILSFSDPLNISLAFGELLIDPFSIPIFDSTVPSGPLFDFHQIPIANDPVLLGRTFYAQAGILAPGSLTLCNGIEYMAGR